MKEYIVYYLVDGKGYNPGEPWIDSKTEDPVIARQNHQDLLDWSKNQQGNTYEIWVEAREIGPWERVDVATLAC